MCIAKPCQTGLQYRLQATVVRGRKLPRPANVSPVSRHQPGPRYPPPWNALMPASGVVYILSCKRQPSLLSHLMVFVLPKYTATMSRSQLLFVLACCLLVAGSQADSLNSAAFARFLAHSANGTIGTVKAGVQTGQVKQIGGLNAYVAGDNASPTAAVILFSDIFGYTLNNSRLWADSLARDTGYLVVLPDFFRGQSFPVDGPPAGGIGPWYVPLWFQQ